jgi:class 3 adenylate cyclase
MINFQGEIIWLNDRVKHDFFNGHIPERSEGRSIFPILFQWAKNNPSHDLTTLLCYHLSLIRSRLHADAFNFIQPLNAEQRQQLGVLLSQVQALNSDMIDDPVITHPEVAEQSFRLVAMTFREGVFVLYVPDNSEVSDIIEWLSHRDSVIRALLAQRLPTLTPLAVMVADLQQSTRICAELPAEEYFALINQIWTSLDPIFRRHYGAYGKHAGDGMLYYFFPQPDQNYLLNAVACAFEIKETMKAINQEWKIKKNWDIDLFMNIGLHSGEEWLGTFKSNTHLELVVLGETINTASRLSDFARYGQIWATKRLIDKLQSHDRNHIEYGIQRQGEHPQFIKNTFSLIENLVGHAIETSKLRDIQGVAVAEVIGYKA